MKTLVVYGTKYGATEKCAKMLADKLPGDIAIERLQENKVLNVDEYDGIIIGGSIYAGKIQKEVQQFYQSHLEKLKQKKLGLFICCGMSDKAEAQLSEAFPSELTSHAAAMGYFGYEFSFEKMSFVEKLMVKVLAKQKQSCSHLKPENIDRFINTYLQA